MGAGASGTAKDVTTGMLAGSAKADEKEAENSNQPDAQKVTKDLDRLAQKDPQRFKKAVRLAAAPTPLHLVANHTSPHC